MNQFDFTNINLQQRMQITKVQPYCSEKSKKENSQEL